MDSLDKVVAMLLLLAWSAAAYAETRLLLNNRSILFEIEDPQRCYTLPKRWEGRTENATWETFPEARLPNSSVVVFFQEQHCRGRSVSCAYYPYSSCDLNGTVVYQNVNSVLVSRYAINSNGTLNSSISSFPDVGDT